MTYLDHVRGGLYFRGRTPELLHGCMEWRGQGSGQETSQGADSPVPDFAVRKTEKGLDVGLAETKKGAGDK